MYVSSRCQSRVKARKNLGELLEEVYYRGDQYIIERAGKPMAAVVPLSQLEAWQEQREAFFRSIDAVQQKNQATKPETIEQEVEEAVKSTRKSRRKSL
jgi:prevent-host-death family protein